MTRGKNSSESKMKTRLLYLWNESSAWLLLFSAVVIVLKTMVIIERTIRRNEVSSFLKFTYKANVPVCAQKINFLVQLSMISLSRATIQAQQSQTRTQELRNKTQENSETKVCTTPQEQDGQEHK